jgi:hypothetical protein
MHSMTFGEIRDTRGDGCNLLAQADLFGVSHHLIFIKVEVDDDGIQGPAAAEDGEVFADFGALYDFAYETVNVPGFDGDYVAVMHPYGA